jgi:endoglucanase
MLFYFGGSQNVFINAKYLLKYKVIMKNTCWRLLVVLMLLNSHSALSEIFIRHNQAGYSPNRIKQVIVMSDQTLSQQTWRVISSDNSEVLSGVFDNSLAGKSDHTAKAYHYLIDISELNQLGDYSLMLGSGESESIQIVAQPFQKILPAMLRFLRVARSGTSDTLLTPVSHLGDETATIYRPTGDIALGQWYVDTNNQTVDMLGGWYDAADYIKFTLTTAYTSYFLLRAYQESPELFVKTYSQSDLVDILDETKHGLDYLVKTHPSDHEFIIQVSTGADHLQGYRLPQNDARNGEREALSAISPAQMGLTSAALALGSQIFKQQGLTELANQYQQTAVAIYHRARESDALTDTAFERDTTNDFYLDKEPNDNMGLAAIELFNMTNEAHYLSEANEYSQKAGNGEWATWCCVTTSLNYRLSRHSDNAAQLFHEELSGYQNYDLTKGNIWGIPMEPSWAPLPGASIAAAYSGLDFLENNKQDTDLLWNNIDYFFGRNNWGVSFIALPELQRPAKNVYSQVYSLTDEYPLGAVAEGPGSKDTFLSLKAYFTPSDEDAYFEQFNTTSQIFYDNNSNFQTMESTIVGQATAIYMLAIAHKVSLSEKYQPSIKNDTTNIEAEVVDVSKDKKSGSSMMYLLMLLLALGLYRKINVQKSLGS